MARSPSPAIRDAVVERAAELLARREPVTLRAVVEGTGASTMAVYTYFGGMPGLWRAVRQEGFTRLARSLGEVTPTRDPVRDLAAMCAAYTLTALANPDVYRAMFDATAELEHPDDADATFGRLVMCAARARTAGRIAPDADPATVATRVWVAGHGLVSLVVGGALPIAALDEHAPDLVTAVLVAAGAAPAACRRSVLRGWARAGGRAAVLPSRPSPT